ncbi:MAG: hemerythrin domain-containing protein [Deltaproteobacteria bacterium]|nr:hemerythrin domain-containing protein [Deltaproteobacteria bacterium]
MQTLGRRDESDEPGALILACHERIRGFVAAAARLASDAPASDADVAATAAAVARYFRVALPLHEADEDRSIAPRLAGVGGEVAETLAAIAREHAELAAPIAALIAIADQLADRPGERAHARRALEETVATLAAIFARHLGREEAVMIPAIAALPAAAKAAIRDEMRARRT